MGKPNADASALLSGLLGSDLQMVKRNKREVGSPTSCEGEADSGFSMPAG